jgi:hypothetical protein
VKPAIAVAGIGSAAFALSGQRAMAAVSLVLLFRAPAIRRIGGRLDDIEELLLGR